MMDATEYKRWLNSSSRWISEASRYITRPRAVCKGETNSNNHHKYTFFLPEAANREEVNSQTTSVIQAAANQTMRYVAGELLQPACTSNVHAT
jgi:hypothetical protein